MHIAIIGATGLVGSSLLQKLIQNPRVQKITTITRRPLDTSHDKLNQLVLSRMSPDHIRTMSVKADVFICALGTTIKIAGSKEAFKAVDHDLVVAFAQLAKKGLGKALFVVSALGSNKDSMIFYNRVKGEMEADILALELPATYILRPSLIIGERKEKRLGEELGIGVFRALRPIFPKKLTAYMGSEVPDIVNYTEKAIFAIQPGAHKVTYFS